MSDIKQVIVVRKDLHMRKGKIAAQVAHASMKVLLDRAFRYFDGKTHKHRTKFINYRITAEEGTALYKWLEGKFTKVVVYCNSEEELDKVVEECGLIPHSVVIDSGLTEFNNVPTKTCVAIGPWYSKEIDKITGEFKLL